MGGGSRFTMEAVAARAGASKATLYRRWSSASALLVDAMAEAFHPLSSPDTGDVRHDLAALLHDVTVLMTRSDFPRLMAAVIDLSERDPALAALHARITENQRRPLLEILQRALQRGELDPNSDPELLADLIAAPFFYRRFIAHRPIPDGMAHDVIDQVLPRKAE